MVHSVGPSQSPLDLGHTGEPPAPSFLSLLGLVLGSADARVKDLVAATVTLYSEGESRSNFATVGVSHEAGRHMDEVQYRVGDGPCVRCTHSGEEVLVEFPFADWEELSVRAGTEGVMSAWSMPLVKNPKAAASLNLYFASSGSSVWEGENWAGSHGLAHEAAKVLTAWAAFSDMRNANANLRIALESRTMIGQAEGVLMARQDISADEAFDILRRTSQRSNRKVRDVAADIVAPYNRAAHGRAVTQHQRADRHPTGVYH